MPNAKFQFQTGAIKRVCFGDVAKWISTGFNSKLVRLKVIRCGHCGDSVVFQFQTGAIKRFYLDFGLRSRYTFQFQTGAIKSCGW